VVDVSDYREITDVLEASHGGSILAQGTPQTAGIHCGTYAGYEPSPEEAVGGRDDTLVEGVEPMGAAEPEARGR
jgi:hypothetical protein